MQAAVVQKYAGATAVRSTYNRSQATQTTTYNSRGATAPPVSTASVASQAGTVVVKVSRTTTSKITTPAVTASTNSVTTAGNTTTSKQVGTPAVTATSNSVKTTNTGTSATRITTPAVTRDAAALQAARSTLTKNLTAPKEEENSFMDGVHTVLDAAGYIPCVGDLADLINSVIYAAEGDWTDAVISAAAVFIDGATAGRLARNSSEIAGEAVETVTKRAVKNSSGKFVGEATGDIGQDIAEEIWDQISEYMDEDETIKNTLPNADKAVIDPRKLTEYALNPDHPIGCNKARVFESALGYNKSNADDLMKQIYEKLPDCEAVLGKLDQYGQRYTVDIPITGSNGCTVNVRTGWIIKSGSEIPELTTIYVKE